jgi:D-glycero-beta-D-manno-heptose-7-phosphate kinase
MNFNKATLSKGLTNVNALVIGDFMVDYYQIGSSTRMSPEAPVPIVNQSSKVIVPGGAGNVAINLKNLGVNVSCIGCVGNDYWGNKLRKILQNAEIDINNLEQKTNHITTLKQRIISNNSQILRVDNERILEDWVPKNKINYEKFDIIILSDYNKGIFNLDWFNPKNIDVILDPKCVRKELFKSCSIITPNLNELSYLTDSRELNNRESVITASKVLIDKYRFKYVIAKQGSKGMSLIGRDKSIHNINAYDIQPYDVTGAGDTVISTFSAFYAFTKNVKVSTYIANIAAAIVVSKQGTNRLTLQELHSFIDKNVDLKTQKNIYKDLTLQK